METGTEAETMKEHWLTVLWVLEMWAPWGDRKEREISTKHTKSVDLQP